ncbi:MAG: HAD family hydrolase [Bacteroidota bacterium]|nr:HAD family hydrolase [Bacteroidota bacterium]
MAKHPAVFLDRDGTIIEDIGYIKDPMDLIFYPESFKALQRLQNHFLLFIITNQSGVSKGITTEREVKEVNNYLLEMLKARGIVIYDIFSCPHKTEDNCSCKKPNPYFINKAAELYNLDLAKSFIIGDHPSDVYCGINAGVNPIYVLTGHGKKHQHEITEEVITCKNVLDASNYIVSYKNKYERL